MSDARILGAAGAGPGATESAATLGAAFRAAMSRWVSGATVVAVRDGRTIHAITATAFCSVSIEPPLVLVCIGPNATVLPLLEHGAGLAISVLADTQRRLASMFADPAPIGREAFTAEGPALIPGALFGLVCAVEARYDAGDHVIVVARVHDVAAGSGEAPLIRYDRTWRGLG